MSEASSTPVENKGWFSEGLILGGIPVWGYLVSFAYEAGYCYRFGVPWEMITPSPTTVFIAAIAVFIYLVALVVIPNAAYLLWRRHPLMHFASWLLPPLLLAGAYYCLFDRVNYSSFALLPVNVVAAVLTYRTICRIERAVAAGDEQARDAELERLQKLADKLPTISTIRKAAVAATILISVSGAYELGSSQGYRRSTFLVPNTHPDLVVVRIYGERLVCSAFDRKKRVLRPELCVLKSGEDPKLRLQWQNLGRLAYGQY